MNINGLQFSETLTMANNVLFKTKIHNNTDKTISITFDEPINATSFRVFSTITKEILNSFTWKIFFNIFSIMVKVLILQKILPSNKRLFKLRRKERI